MPKRSSGLSGRWLLLAGLLCCSSCQSVPSSFENKTGQTDNGRPRIFSPRMDYDEWTPLGRGDPLKNNPTFDYVPPVLDRVQYWLDSHTTEPSSKRDILVLGVTAKKTSPKIPEQFLKFVDGPKFTRVGVQETGGTYRNDFTGSGGAEPPKVVRTTSFRNGLIDYRNQNRLQPSLPASYYPSPYYGQKMKPYTMMMPPPMIPKAETSTGYNNALSKDKAIGYNADSTSYSTQTEEGPVLQDAQYYASPSKDYGHYSPSPPRPYSTSKAPAINKGVAVSQIETIKSVYTPAVSSSTRSRYETTTAPSSVSFEKSNLIYQSTQTLSGGWLGNSVAPFSSSSSSPTSSSVSTGFTDVNQATWQTTDYGRDHYDHHAAASSNREVVVGQNANVIVDGGGNEKGDVVAGHQKETNIEPTSSSTTENVAQTSVVVPTSATSSNSEEVRVEEEGSATDAQPPKMHIVVANLETHKAKKGPVAVVMPTNYAERNPTVEPTTTTARGDVWDGAITSEMTKTTWSREEASPGKPRQPASSSSAPIPTDDRPSASPLPNRMMTMSSSQPPSSHESPATSASRSPPVPAMPARDHGMFLPPQAASQSISVHPQFRPPTHAMMHLIGSMRPGFRGPLSPPISMSHAVSSSMTHVHGAPPLMTMGVSSQQHQQPSQQFPVLGAFTGLPSSTQQTAGPDERTTRLPETIGPNYSVTTAPPFVPTVSSTVEYAPVDGERQRQSTRTDQSALAKILGAEGTTARTTTTTTSAAVAAAMTPSSTTAPPRTTTAPSLTTDPIFSHYKQPAKPLRGPMYLIIQGHSKVKTYKPTVNKHGVPVENNEIAVGTESGTERQLSKLEQLIRENTKGRGIDPPAVDPAEKLWKPQEKTAARAERRPASRQDDGLMSLVESGLNDFTVAASPAASSAGAVTAEVDNEDDNERRANWVTSSVEIN